MREHKIPMRRCVGCMTSFPKKDVIRLVSKEDKPVIDSSGRMNGRGAYICRSMECFDLAIKKKRLNHALGIVLTPDEVSVFRDEYAKELSNAEVCE